MVKYCGAKKKLSTKTCMHPAGWGTDHIGTGKCKLHGGSLVTAQKGNQHARKHGIYSTIFKTDELDEAAEMVGSVDTELAIARLQLRNLLELQQKQGDQIVIDQVEERTLSAEGRDGGEESEPLERKAVARRRDFGGEFNRLTRLIEALERTRLELNYKRIVTKKVSEEGQGDVGDTKRLTDIEMDDEILRIAEGFSASVPFQP
jgi:hypothetical protein